MVAAAEGLDQAPLLVQLAVTHPGEDDEDKEFSVEGVEDRDGTEAVKLSVDDSEDGGTITAYVAAASPHYILSIEKSGGDDDGAATFSHFDESVEVSAPAEDETVDLSSMG